MSSRSIRSLGAATLFVAMAVMAPETAIAADPLLPTAGAWVAIATDGGGKWVTGGDTAAGVSTWPESAITELQFQFVKTGNGPDTLTSVNLQRPRGQYERPFGLPIGAQPSTVLITLRKPAAGGQADWFIARLTDPKVKFDEVRTSRGSTTGTEILELSFSKVVVSHRVETAQGYGPYTEVPPQFDIQDNVALLPSATSPASREGSALGELRR